MTDVSGRWACTAQTPMGPQRFTLTVERSGDRFTGRTEGAMGSAGIEDGEVQGDDRLVWTMRTTIPMPLTLDCEARVEGDRIAGSVRAGLFGTYAVSGEREG